MIILYTLLGLILYSFIVIVIGKINLTENIQKKIFIIMSTIYNIFMGYIDTFVITLLYTYFANIPKGSAYEVPESERAFNTILGFITLFIYLVLLIPINIYMKKKGKINLSVYMIVNIIATAFGIAIFWLFFNQDSKLL